MNELPLVAELGDDQLSPYKRYLKMFVGQNSFNSFLRYELLTSLLGPLPGAAGYFLRGKLYRFLLKKTGKGTVFGKNVVLRCPGRISLGQKVMIDDGVVLDAKGASSSIETGDSILIGRNSVMSCGDSTIRMGNFLSIGAYCTINSRSLIDIGSYVQIGTGVQLMAGSHSYDDPDTPTILQKRVSKGITVEDNVWLGNASIILDGVRIGRNSIVGVGAAVTKDVPPYTIVLGNPARVIQKRK
jgi:acetyltransferase-like isoleucine patch superfamily enzyme